ncbi:hypothetical protein IGI04_015319, partial [Brassica rapa subsp. trilocularis]
MDLAIPPELSEPPEGDKTRDGVEVHRGADRIEDLKKSASWEDVRGDVGKGHEENISIQVGEKNQTKEKEGREEEVKAHGNVWSTPIKIGKVLTNPSQTNTPEIQISDSRFSVLMDERDEGEILKDNDMLEGMEEDGMEDDIIDQSVKEWKKLGMQKGRKRGQKTK